MSSNPENMALPPLTGEALEIFTEVMEKIWVVSEAMGMICITNNGSMSVAVEKATAQLKDARTLAEPPATEREIEALELLVHTAAAIAFSQLINAGIMEPTPRENTPGTVVQNISMN